MPTTSLKANLWKKYFLKKKTLITNNLVCIASEISDDTEVLIEKWLDVYVIHFVIVILYMYLPFPGILNSYYHLSGVSLYSSSSFPFDGFLELKVLVFRIVSDFTNLIIISLFF